MQALLDRLSAGDSAIDVGANVGTVTMRLAQAVGPTGAVLALEPNAEAADQCQRACQRWPWVTVRRVAVTDRDGDVPLYRGAQTVYGSLAESNVPTVTDSVMVPCDTLDHVAETLPRLRAIKIDAQGAEGRILTGATRLLQRADLVWVLELWPEGLRGCGSSVQEVCAVLASYGWAILAYGKQLESPPLPWAQLEALASRWTKHGHTNVLIGRS